MTCHYFNSPNALHGVVCVMMKYNVNQTPATRPQRYCTHLVSYVKINALIHHRPLTTYLVTLEPQTGQNA